MDPKIFQSYRDLIYAKSGIVLGPQKVSLVSSRIAKRMRALGLDDPRDYLQCVIDDQSENELVQLLDAISTNVTSFYREEAHFDFLAQALAKWSAAGQTRFRIWCAAASTGEEPYTIAITALESLGAGPYDLRILATDISTKVLRFCLQGEYPEKRVEPVPQAQRQRYFDCRYDEARQPIYRVNDSLRRLITFRRLNLATPPYPMSGPMDVVFCRNVMIYFDEALRAKITHEACRMLKPGGYLIVGHSESLLNIASGLQTVRPAVYMKR